MSIQYIDKLKHWELSCWWKLTIRLGILNFFLIAIGFMGVAGGGTSLIVQVLAKAYIVCLVAWAASIAGTFRAWYRHYCERVIR